MNVPVRTPLGELEKTLGCVLLIGSIVSTLLLALGLGASVFWPARPAGDWLLRTGLMVLMGTPAVRVTVSAVEYARNRDWLFAALTAIVLLVLAGSLAVAL